MSQQEIKFEITIPDPLLGQRLDQVLAELFPDYSRSRIKEWIINCKVTVDGRVVKKPKERVLGGEKVNIDTVIEAVIQYKPQNLPLSIVYEDNSILVINKSRGVVVHPGAGNPDGTVLNALLYHYPESASLPRAGIVHRLDKDTTGLMVVSKTIPSQNRLVQALQNHEIIREYEAIATGVMTTGGTVNEPIARHPAKRTHMSVFPLGKLAVTHYRIMERFRMHTRLRLRLETGRTHQIRVHMAHIAHPLVGDKAYGGRPRPPKGASEKLMATLRSFDRQALHAAKLGLIHPVTGEKMVWEAPLPDDMVELIAVLHEDKKQFKGEIDW